jgi:hypothetical protein
MTDLEMIKKCAEKMGYVYGKDGIWDGGIYKDGERIFSHSVNYNPLHDDAQAMALVKKFGLHLRPYDVDEGREWCVSCPDPKNPEYFFFHTYRQNLNTAIVECVSKLP